MPPKYRSVFVLILTSIICFSFNANAGNENSALVDNSFDALFLGKWEIKKWGVEYEILKSKNRITVKGSDAVHNEEFDVYDVKWEEPYIYATFRMPSTNHVTHSRLKVVNSNVIEDLYTGDASGKDYWKRKE